jgi:hypothetical protein
MSIHDPELAEIPLRIGLGELSSDLVRRQALAEELEGSRPVSGVGVRLRCHGPDSRFNPRHHGPDGEELRLDGHAKVAVLRIEGGDGERGGDILTFDRLVPRETRAFRRNGL